MWNGLLKIKEYLQLRANFLSSPTLVGLIFGRKNETKYAASLKQSFNSILRNIQIFVNIALLEIILLIFPLLLFKQMNSYPIEEAYLKTDSSRPSSNTFNFTTNQFSYEINFNRKKQKNLNPRYATEREIRRRPVFVRFECTFLLYLSKSNTLTLS